jgi:hypothetical protein
MTRFMFAASAAILLVPGPAPAAPSFPLISGKYVVTIDQQCQPSLFVTYGNIGSATVVTGVSLDEASSAGTLGAGTFDATGNTSGSGTLALTATQSEGDPIVLDSNNGGGAQGTLLSVATSKGSVPFTQTATTFALTDKHGVSTFNVYYGASKSGIVESAVFGGMDDTGCMETGTVSRQ